MKWQPHRGSLRHQPGREQKYYAASPGWDEKGRTHSGEIGSSCELDSVVLSALDGVRVTLSLALTPKERIPAEFVGGRG